MTNAQGNVFALSAAVLGEAKAGSIVKLLRIDPRLDGDGTVTRAQLAMALNAALFSDLLDRVPTGARYVAEVAAPQGPIWFDHGALRTIDGPTGALPPGHMAFARLLEPMGYRVGGVYPLPRLKMTGRAFVHRDFPDGVPQFFVSELHVAQLPDDARAAAERVFGASRDPLDAQARRLLEAMARDDCDLDLARAGLPALVSAFGRQHRAPTLTDYETLLAASPEAAWIATEGNAFNHATDRVPDVAALAERLRAAGYPIKAEVEISANGRVRQTAFIADKVVRSFLLPDGGMTEREVPGSFYEFISRDLDPETDEPDLSFDSGNATGIFSVTRAT